MPRFSDFLRRGFAQGTNNLLLVWHRGAARLVEAGPVLQASGRLDLLGGFKLNHTILTVAHSPYKVDAKDYLIGVDTSNGPITVELPTAASVGSGFTLVVKDEGGIANVNNITVRVPVRETLDGGGSLTVSTAYASNQLYTDGTNWYVFGNSP